jgi:uncharacterized membrane protein
MRLGVYVFGIASLAAGIFDLIWGEFESAHQPIHSLGVHIPGVKILAYIAALWLVAGGAAILSRRTACFGAMALAIIYLIFGVFSFPRFYTTPHPPGYRVSTFVGVVDEIAQQFILVVAAVVFYASLSPPASSPQSSTSQGSTSPAASSRASSSQGSSSQRSLSQELSLQRSLSSCSLSKRSALILRCIFGLCSVDFGLAHLTIIRHVAPMVPKWMPLGGAFWAVFTGIAFILAGLAILTGILDVLAARLLALMLLVFSLLLLGPLIFAYPHNHIAWGANAYNLAAVGATWMFAAWLATRHDPAPSQTP